MRNTLPTTHSRSKPEAEKLTPVSARLPHSLVERIDSLAASTERSRTKMVATLLKAALARDASEDITH